MGDAGDSASLSGSEMTVLAPAQAPAVPTAVALSGRGGLGLPLSFLRRPSYPHLPKASGGTVPPRTRRSLVLLAAPRALTAVGARTPLPDGESAAFASSPPQRSRTAAAPGARP